MTLNNIPEDVLADDIADDEIVEVTKEVPPNDADEEVPVPPAAPIHNNPIISPFKEPEEYDESQVTLNLQGDVVSREELAKLIVDYKIRLQKSGVNPDGDTTLSELQRSKAIAEVVTFLDGEFYDRLNSPDANWVQTIDSISTADKPAVSKKIRPGHIVFRVADDVEDLEGKNAMRYLSRLTGTGVPTKVQLWHSGLTLSLDAFRDRRLLDLNIAINRERVQLGNATRGASFSGDDVYIVMIIVDFILDHVIECNMRGWNKKLLMSHILTLDIPALLAGALGAIYPSGYPVYHDCKNVVTGKCSYNLVAERKPNDDYQPDSMLEFIKVTRVDTNKLDPTQIAHMSLGADSVTKKDVRDYQSKMSANVINDDGEVWTNGSDVVKAIFKVPNLVDYERESKDWIGRIVNMVDRAASLEAGLTADERVAKKQEFLERYSSTLDSLKHISWISHFEVISEDGTVRTISEDSAVKESLEMFSGAVNFKSELDDKIQHFKEENMISYTGIPNFACPVCGESQTEEDSITPTLIPINMVGMFFLVLEWRAHTVLIQ